MVKKNTKLQILAWKPKYLKNIIDNIPSVDKWILKYCDMNKDVELEEIGQLMDLNIQIKYAGEAFRLYVKNQEDKFILRGEKVMKVNQPITSFLNDSIQYPFNLINNKLDKFDEKLNNVINKNGKLERN